VGFRNLAINNKSPDLRGKGPEVQLVVFFKPMLIFSFSKRKKEKRVNEWKGKKSRKDIR